MNHTESLPVPGQGLWTTAQILGVVLTLVLVAGMFTAPELSLDLLWNAAIPILPAVFLVSPPIWRNVCPLATLTMWGSRRATRRHSEATSSRLGAVGIVLLLAMVPARRFLFNTDGTALAVTVVAVALLAFVLGTLFVSKAGFCNTLCPVLPVERLYGQSPLLQIGNPRCTPCIGCTERGCVDRVPYQAVDEAINVDGSSNRWLLTPFGAFAAAFPGFVWGYFSLTDTTIANAASVYGTIALWMVVSFLVLGALAVVGLSRTWVIRLAAASAITIYYWFGAATVADTWALGASFATAVRLAAIALVLVWLWKAATRPTPIAP